MKENLICIYCLTNDHTVSNRIFSKCRLRNRLHNTLLHRYTTTFPTATNSTNNQLNDNQLSTSRGAINYTSIENDQVYLATVLVLIKDRSCEYQLARALLDSGSQINWVPEEWTQKLGLQRNEFAVMYVVGIGNAQSTVSQKLDAAVRSRVYSHGCLAELWVL